MKATSLRKILAMAAILPMLALSAVSGPLPTAQADHDGHEAECSEIQLVSDTAVRTAGYTETDPGGLPTATQPSTYSEGNFGQTAELVVPHPAWLDASTDPAFAGTFASWISTDMTLEGSAENDQWRLFRDSFELPEGAIVDSAEVWVSADNAVEVYHGEEDAPASILTTGDVFGTAGSNTNFDEVFNASFTPVEGENVFNFVLRNWASEGGENPTGLLYRVAVEYCLDDEDDDADNGDDENVTVTIVKFIDGQMADTDSADGAEFPMSSEWDADNTGAGSGTFVLGPDDYTAVTAEMSAGADYSTEEILDTDVVSATCEEDGTPFALMGYTVGDSLEDAMDNDMSTSSPELTDIQEDQTIIVWNDDCATPDDDDDEFVQVHIMKYLDGEPADADSADSHEFDMESEWTADNLNGGAMASGTFVLGPDDYTAVTAEMSAGADYTASEVTDPEGMVLPLDADCEEGKFRLNGYRWSSTSFEDAEDNTLMENAPEFTDLDGDRFLIVDNEICPVDDDDDDVDLEVSVEVIDNTATAGSGFEGGWAYLFHITAPEDEENLAMKFDDWLRDGGGDTIPVANNMRISSEQASSTDPVVLTAADTYSSPDLVLVEDLDEEEDGRQVEVLVEVQIPAGTQSGTYTTEFGVRTLP